MIFKKYTFAVKHDNGIQKLTTVSTSAKQAKINILLAESCPPHSVALIKTKTIK